MKKYFMRFFIFCAVLMLQGCAKPAAPAQTIPAVEEVVSKPNQTAQPALADSLDRAVIQKIDEANQKITFYNLTVQKSYTLSYDNATGMKSRYEEELVAGQLMTGDVVEVAFVKDEKYAKNIWLDQSATVTDNVTTFKINRVARTFEMNGEQYSIKEGAPVLAEGQVLDLMDINQVDTLRVMSVDHEIYSITIANGHGYVRLLGAEAFEGGWVEFGQSIIRKVEKDMLLVVPAGNYDMLISKEGNTGTKPVAVTANEETQVDVSDLVKVEEQGEGGIVFTITPSTAVLKIDGEETDYSSVVNLSYGIHQIEAIAEGYRTVSRYIKVGSEMANISIEMEEKTQEQEEENEEDDKDKDSESSNPSVSGNSALSPENEGDYKVYIDAPEGAELYVDGKYVGILPTSFAKKSGTYTISVRKSGYKTRSYSLEVDNTQKDVRYSFSSLEKEE